MSPSAPYTPKVSIVVTVVTTVRNNGWLTFSTLPIFERLERELLLALTVANVSNKAVVDGK